MKCYDTSNHLHDKILNSMVKWCEKFIDSSTVIDVKRCSFWKVSAVAIVLVIAAVCGTTGRHFGIPFYPQRRHIFGVSWGSLFKTKKKKKDKNLIQSSLPWFSHLSTLLWVLHLCLIWPVYWITCLFLLAMVMSSLQLVWISPVFFPQPT